MLQHHVQNIPKKMQTVHTLLWFGSSKFLWFSAKLQYLHCLGIGDTAVLH